MSKSTKQISDIILVKDDTRVRVEFSDGIASYFSIEYFQNACSRIGKSAQSVMSNPDGFSLRGEFTKHAKGEAWENEETGETGEYSEANYSCNQLRVVLSSAGALHQAVASEAAQAIASMLGAGSQLGAPVAPVAEETSDTEETPVVEEQTEPVIETSKEK